MSSISFFACSAPESSAEPVTELGSTTQALKHERQSPLAALLKLLHRKHHGHGHGHGHDCEEPEPEPEPEAFTPALAAARSGRRAGVAVANGPLAAEPIYAELVAAQFSDITPENEMKWGPLQPVDARHWEFDPADAIVDFADDNEMAVKGHTLIWHNQLPSFIDDSTSRKDLARYAERHIERTVEHFERDVFAWDVVNEAIADDGSGLRPTPFAQAFGEEYIDRAFRLAHKRDRRAELYYNDYGIEGFGPKSDAVYALMQRLIERRVPIDGIGFQGHFDARFTPSYDELVANFQRFADLGLSLNVSELDVRVARLGGSRAYRLAVQKQIYQRVAAACLAVEACDGVTTWGFTDAHSWIDSTFEPDDPLLFDDSYQKKPAYFGYVDGFMGVPLDDASLEPNLIGNSTFEAGLDGWSVMGSGTIASELAAAHTGARSARASGRTANWQGPRHDVTALVSPLRSYDGSVWVRLAGAASANTSLTAHISCAGQDPIFQPLASTAANDAGWVQLSGSFEVPSCELTSVALYVEGPDAGVDILVDDLALREVPPPNLVANPGFESGTGGWFGFGPTVLGTTTDAASGERAVIGTGRTATWNGIATDLTSRVVATATYRAEARVKIAGAASDRVGLTAAVGCAGEATRFLPIGSAMASNGAYVTVSGSVQVPNCSVTSFILYAEGPAAGVDILMDDVAFWQIDAGLPPSILANGNFETNTDWWFGFGPVTIESTTARAHGGARSARVTNRTDTWQGLATSLVGRLTPGKSYSVSAWAQVGTGSSNVNLTFQNACEGGSTNFTWITGATANDSTWTQLQGTLVAPNCNLTTGNFYIEGAPAGVDIYLDDVEIRELP